MAITLQDIINAQRSVQYGEPGQPATIINPATGQREVAWMGFGSQGWEGDSAQNTLLLPESVAREQMGTLGAVTGPGNRNAGIPGLTEIAGGKQFSPYVSTYTNDNFLQNNADILKFAGLVGGIGGLGNALAGGLGAGGGLSLGDPTLGADPSIYAAGPNGITTSLTSIGDPTLGADPSIYNAGSNGIVVPPPSNSGIGDPTSGADPSIYNAGPNGLPVTVPPTSIGDPTSGADPSIYSGSTQGSGTFPASGTAVTTGAGAGTSAATKWLAQQLGISEGAADLLGKAVPGLLGAFAANQQSNSLTDLAKQFSEYGAPSRARFEASMTPGFDPTTIPGYSGALDTASDSILRRLSATGGNPYGNPGGLIEANKAIVSGTALPAIQEYQRTNAGAGGLVNLAAAYPQTQAAATTAGSGVWNALGDSAASIFTPKTSLAELWKQFRVSPP